MDHQKAIIVGISGCSSSGKTTLARLLRDIFPNTFILHEDDFYKPEDQLPIKDGLVDWDCPEAISIPDMEKALTHIRSTGTFPVSFLALDTPTLSHRHDHGTITEKPVLRDTDKKEPSLTRPNTSSVLSPPQQPEVDSKEDQNSVGESPVTAEQITAAKQKVQEWLQPGQPGSRIFPPVKSGPRICLLDGFLLYSPTHLPETLMTKLIDIKLFLLVSRGKATQRREARDGYVTLEGFWTDPPGYVEKIVWPNYAAAHRWLFEEGDAEKGVLNKQAMEKYGVLAQVDKGLDVPFGETLDWAVEMIMRELEKIVFGGGEDN
ncbi:nicotinamide riboside kinase [Naviculisporaceae sp. PSN 640]